jgi:hypothetical protein
VDLEGSLAIELFAGIYLRAGAAVERYGYVLRPEPATRKVAGGALDQYLHLFARVGYSL